MNDSADLLRQSIEGLRAGRPEFSAHRVLSQAQVLILLGAGMLLALSAVLRPMPTGRLLVAAITTCCVATLAYRVLIFTRGRTGGTTTRVSAEEAHAVPDSDLPVYSVLVPAYREPEVMPSLLEGL